MFNKIIIKSFIYLLFKFFKICRNVNFIHASRTKNSSTDFHIFEKLIIRLTFALFQGISFVLLSFDNKSMAKDFMYYQRKISYHNCKQLDTSQVNQTYNN